MILPLISLGEIDSALNHLTFAVMQSLRPLYVDVKVEYADRLPLAVIVKCYGRDLERVKAIMLHGVLYDKYDYRFRGCSHMTSPVEHSWTEIRFHPDFEHDKEVVARRKS